MPGFSATPEAKSNSTASDSERVTDTAQLRICVAWCGLVYCSEFDWRTCCSVCNTTRPIYYGLCTCL